jgi:hypothetical protein
MRLLTFLPDSLDCHCDLPEEEISDMRPRLSIGGTASIRSGASSRSADRLDSMLTRYGFGLAGDYVLRSGKIESRAPCRGQTSGYGP